MTTTLRAWMAVMAAVSLLTVACDAPPSTDDDSMRPAAGWPAQLSEFTMTWDAEPGIDLTRGAAVVVRAYLESFYLAHTTGDLKYLYPGFRRAVEPNTPSGRDGTDSRWPSVQGGPDTSMTLVGTVRHRILRLDRTVHDVAALGCTYTYGAGMQIGRGYKMLIGLTGNPNAGIYPIRVGMRAPELSESETPQRGPERAPSNDVFGGWKVTNHRNGYMTDSSWDGYQADRDACAARADEPSERHLDRWYRQSRDEIPVQAAVPGWPSPNGS